MLTTLISNDRYHKEKKLVDAVIKAEEALRAKEASLPNPMGPQTDALDIEHQFLTDQRKHSNIHILTLFRRKTTQTTNRHSNRQL